MMPDYVFNPSNVLTFETVQNDSKRLFKLMDDHHDMTSLRFNLSAVSHCDSTGLALLIEVKRRCLQQGIVFQMENMSESLHGLAEFCGVDKVLS